MESLKYYFQTTVETLSVLVIMSVIIFLFNCTIGAKQLFKEIEPTRFSVSYDIAPPDENPALKKYQKAGWELEK